MVVLSRRSTRTPASSSSFAFMTMSSEKRKLVIRRPQMLTLPPWSSNASHMILSRKMLKSGGESRHPYRTVVLNHSPMLPLNRTALRALSYRFSMAHMMLALMLYFLIVTHKASCHNEVYEDMVEILLMLQVFLAEDPEIEYCSVVLLPALKPACSSAMISSACGWSLFRMILNMTLLGWLIKLMVL